MQSVHAFRPLYLLIQSSGIEQLHQFILENLRAVHSPVFLPGQPAIHAGSETFLRTALVSVAARYASVSMRMIEQIAFSGMCNSCCEVAAGISISSSSATTSQLLAASVIISIASSILFPVVMHPGIYGKPYRE